MLCISIMGSVAANGEGNTVATNYGIYSNVTVNNDDKVAINFSSELGAMQLTDTKDEYKPQTADGKNGDFSVSTQIKNVSQNEMKQIAVAVYPQEGITPYDICRVILMLQLHIQTLSVLIL